MTDASYIAVNYPLLVQVFDPSGNLLQLEEVMWFNPRELTEGKETNQSIRFANEIHTRPLPVSQIS